MGKFITEIIVYENKEWTPEDLFSWGYTHARRHSDITIEIAAHIFNSAFINQDNELCDAARELMSAAGSPCQYSANDNALQATSNYNRPSEPAGPVIPKIIFDNIEDANEQWDDTYDHIFDKKVKPQALFNAMKGIKYSGKITDRRFYYVAYRVLDAINYFSKGTSVHQYLQWINLHFNDSENKWIDDHDHIYLFVFKLDGKAKELKVHPSKWNTIDLYSDLAEIHYKLANDLKNTFTFVVDENGDELKGSESYEHLKDYPQYLSGAKWIVDRYLVPEEAYINKG